MFHSHPECVYFTLKGKVVDNVAQLYSRKIHKVLGTVILSVSVSYLLLQVFLRGPNKISWSHFWHQGGTLLNMKQHIEIGCKALHRNYDTLTLSQIQRNESDTLTLSQTQQNESAAHYSQS